MSGGLFALLDDVSVLARMAAASADDVGAAAGRASAKAAGVVIDDTAVTPQYVHGVAAQRELPIIKRIAIGSLRNKMLIILPVALLLSQFLPSLLTPLLMLGGAYLCFEATEKIWEALSGHGGHGDDDNATKSEEEVVKGAVRTDLILSAEIMVISLNEVAAEGFWARLAILTVVAVAITVVVYGVVALIVKMDDMGLHLAQRSTGVAHRIGRGMVSGMPMVLSVISVVGTAAMLWVGGHIELVGLNELGWHAPYDLVHHLEEDVSHAVPAIGGVLAWLTNTAASAILGLILGALLVAIAHVLPFGGKNKETAAH
jgi:predicted DNA repair protein MutK